MTEHQAQAAEVTALLELDRPPVALAFLAQPPEAVPVVTQASPSSCAFWIRAESSVFYATAVQHQHCQIGAMVMGFDLPPAVMQEIGGLVETMAGCNYLSPEEGDKIPSVTPASAGILYGPLADLPTQPDAVLLWLTPAQAMICQEAIGSASWAEAPERISGRPACAAIPLAMQGQRPRLSFGCKGMRTFTDRKSVV